MPERADLEDIEYYKVCHRVHYVPERADLEDIEYYKVPQGPLCVRKG